MTMPNHFIVRNIAGRMSLRSPQLESLKKLDKAIELAPEILSKRRNLSAVLEKLRPAFPALSDFERNFPSLCFALATGVGKTRLMGAFITYLHQAYGISNFFVLAPNLTIYDKLYADFSPDNAKYVFKGISEFAINQPWLVTGDNYESRGIPKGGRLFEDVTINIFNISKINSEVRGGKSPRIKRLSEYIGDSYFNYLASLPDLVLLMDESHRYRASAGVKALNELNPLLGLELTATPFVEASSGPVPFKNIVMDYPLARALDDGFVKEPAAVTQRDFDPSRHTLEALEKIKLEDGIRVHESTKVELITYARENNLPTVKPFMLIIARDTAHAAQLLALVESGDFCNGRYRGRAIQVDSSRTGAAEEEMVRRLLQVESFDEPTEIVIHVNMLKEGWDVTNLYTIVPLRAANARTLVEQSIGRGLRLPYGRRTGAQAVDRLNIIAHDKFQEIIDEANSGASPIRLQQLILEQPEEEEKKESVRVVPELENILNLSSESPLSSASPKSVDVVFSSDRERQIARLAKEIIDTSGRDLASKSLELQQKNVLEKIVERVEERMTEAQYRLFEDDAEKKVVRDIVQKTAELVSKKIIDIPRIAVTPKGEIQAGFRPFRLDLSNLRLQPRKREIVIHELHSGNQSTMVVSGALTEKRPEDHIVFALMDFDDVDYFSQADLLYDLAQQVTAHLRGYLTSEEDVMNVLRMDYRLMADEIHSQMQAHFHEEAEEYEVRISQGFVPLRACNYSVIGGKIYPYDETPPEASVVKARLYGGFSRCLYPAQKFDSDTERRFAVILERHAEKWFKPAKGQFAIWYKLRNASFEYIPDFIAETAFCILMVETKAEKDLQTEEVMEKKRAALQWCIHASGYAATIGSKPWKYLLVPHNEVNDSKLLEDFLRFEPK